MKKITVELFREENLCISDGVRHSYKDKYSVDSEIVLDAMVKATEKLDDIRVYRHIVTESYDKEHYFDWHGQQCTAADRVYKLHIFYEDVYE